MAGFLKCDAVDCDHEEPITALSPEMIGKACQKCGANLLTQDDYEAGLGVQELIAALVLAGLAKTAPDHPDDISAWINPHAGKTNITIKGAL